MRRITTYCLTQMGDAAVAEVATIDLTAEHAEGLRARVIRASAACVGRWGLSRTRVDDVAREAGVSRATVYRHFPGGRDEILAAVSGYEEGRFFASLLPALEATDSLEDCLVVAISDATAFLAGNEVLGYLAEHEPEVLYPYLAFDRCGPLLHRTTGRVAPQLERFVRADQGAEIVQWATRVVLSCWLQPGSIDLSNEDAARRMVARYLLPGLVADDDHSETHYRTSNSETNLERV